MSEIHIEYCYIRMANLAQIQIYTSCNFLCYFSEMFHKLHIASHKFFYVATTLSVSKLQHCSAGSQYVKLLSVRIFIRS